jgi:hypothetical protein
VTVEMYHVSQRRGAEAFSLTPIVEDGPLVDTLTGYLVNAAFALTPPEGGTVLRWRDRYGPRAWVDEEQGFIGAELWYPRNEGAPTEVRIGLTDVRAADDLIIRFDFERNGWVLLQEEFTEVADGLVPTGQTTEVGFVPAWNIKESS